MFGQQKNDQSDADAAVEQSADSLLNHEPETVEPNGPPVTPTNDYVMTDLPHIAAPTRPAPTAAPSGTPALSPSPAAPVVPSSDNSDTPNDLIELKQSALQELSPLVGHLEQTPEEKFRTTMMMIQASDDQTLLPAAFAAAKDISDEKARAQALLDIINEINYFTQQHAETS
jgi:hypothetical protein